MFSDIFINDSLFPQDVFSLFKSKNRRNKKNNFCEIYSESNHDQQQKIEKKIINLKKKYHNFVLYLPMDILKDDSSTLNDYINTTRGNSHQYIYLLYKIIISIISEYIIKKKYHSEKQTVKYTYFFAKYMYHHDALLKKNKYDHCMIVYSFNKSVINNSEIKKILKEINEYMDNQDMSLKNKCFKKSNFESIPSSILNAFQKILKFYFNDFFKMNHHFLNLFYHSNDDQEDRSASSSDFAQEENDLFFNRFNKYLFFIKNDEYNKHWSLLNYFKFNLLYKAYQIKSNDFNAICSINFKNILLPKISNIIEKTIRQIDDVCSNNRMAFSQDLESDLCSSSSSMVSQSDTVYNDFEDTQAIAEMSLGEIFLKEIHFKKKKKKNRQVSMTMENIRKMEKVTITRALVLYRSIVKNKIMGLFKDNNQDMKKISSIIDRMMFKFYCIFARSLTSSLSVVGDQIHAYRINHQLDHIEETYNTAQMKIISEKPIVQNYTIYDIYRILFSYEMETTYSFRSHLISIFELLTENMSSVYHPISKLSNNIFIVGDPSGGKDLILETFEGLNIEKTVIKESRVSTCADSFESHGRHDDEILFNTEKSFDNMLNKRHNFSGDTSLKDKMTSGRSIARILSYAPDGSRISRTIINEKKCMLYDASNPSILSKIDGGILERYTWITMPPTTFKSSLETINLIIRQRIEGTNIENDVRKMMFQKENRFIQVVSFEMFKMLGVCVDDINTIGANYVLKYMINRLNEETKAYGCLPILQRRLDSIIMLSKCHAVRRIIVKHFFDQKKDNYSPKYIFENIIQPGKLYVKFRDLTLAVGQLSNYVNIFMPCELQIMTSLRYLFISHNYSISFGNTKRLPKTKKNHIQRKFFTFSKKNPKYIRFPINFNFLASKCVQILTSLWEREENCPQPVNSDMFKDCLTQFFNESRVEKNIESYYLPKKFSAIKYNFDTKLFEKPLMSRSTQTQSDQDSHVQFQHEECDKIFMKDRNFLYIHIIYLNRLFDLQFFFYPWSKIQPPIWSPFITEDNLMKKYLEDFVNLKYQNKKKKIVYKLKRKRISQNPIFANNSDPSLHMMKRIELDCLNVHFLSERKFFTFDSSNDDTLNVKIPLYMNIDHFSKLSCLNNDINGIIRINQEKKEKEEAKMLKKSSNKKQRI